MKEALRTPLFYVLVDSKFLELSNRPSASQALTMERPKHAVNFMKVSLQHTGNTPLIGASPILRFLSFQIDATLTTAESKGMKKLDLSLWRPPSLLLLPSTSLREGGRRKGKGRNKEKKKREKEERGGRRRMVVSRPSAGPAPRSSHHAYEIRSHFAAKKGERDNTTCYLLLLFRSWFLWLLRYYAAASFGLDFRAPALLVRGGLRPARGWEF